MPLSSPGAPTTDAAYRVGLLGEGIEASLTPPMHIEEGRQLGLHYSYDVFDVPNGTMDRTQLADFLDRLGAAGYQGLNVTHPYKQAVIPLLDDLSEDAALLGAVNLLTFAQGRTVGHNTDWTGFRSAFVDTLGEATRLDVLQLGAGGAGAATVYALLSLGTQRIAVHDLDLDRATALASRFGDAFPDRTVTVAVSGVDEILGSVDGVVHATPPGWPSTGDGRSTPHGCDRTPGSRRWSTCPSTPSWSPALAPRDGGSWTGA